MDQELLLRTAVLSKDPEVMSVARTTFDDWDVHEVSDFAQLAALEGEGRLDYVLIDVDILLGMTPTGNHRSCLEVLHQASIGARVVVLTVPGRVRDAVDFVRMGADDYLTGPPTPESLIHARMRARYHNLII